MQLEKHFEGTGTKARFGIRLARTQEDVRKAQRLRWQVFVDEQGARIDSPVPGFDIDRFDDFCEHLVIFDLQNAEAIGTYRLLTADASKRCGGYYSGSEFDLGFLMRQPRRFLEIGRSCVHPNYRNGATITLLWSGIAQYLVQSGHDGLIGCASIPLGNSKPAVARLARELASTYRSEPPMRVHPLRPLPQFGATDAPLATVGTPPLLKGYFRSGAVICGEPCWDPDFDTADLFVYLGVENVAARYARRFLQPGPTG